MRIVEKRRGFFRGTHKGADIQIERDRTHEDSRFYIRVRWKDGGHLYDGWAPAEITSMEMAKREAIKGAGLGSDN